MGPRSSSYAEIVSVGVPGRYQGLMLGWAPDGLGMLSWDSKGAEELNAKEIQSSDRKTLLAAAGPLRAGSVPNTLGMFLHDGGTIGQLLQDPENAIAILYAGHQHVSVTDNTRHHQRGKFIRLLKDRLLLCPRGRHLSL